MQIGSTNTTTITLGVSGDTINVPSGVTIANAGTATGFGDNTPSLKAVRGSGQTIATSTSTVVIFDTEIYDTDSAYDNSTGIFTVPSGEGGKYAFFVTGGFNSSADINVVNFWLSKNNQTAISATTGAAIGIDAHHNGTVASGQAQQVSGCFDLAAGDTMRVYAWHNYGSNRDLNQGGRMTFSGFKLI
tara:strand:+ start:24 stop:587 length:564 start_codon:yes stop_codon:yes gene_type:complete